jgi:transposase
MCQWPSWSGARFISFFLEVPHAGGATGEEVMEVMYPRCASLDVHKETVVACVRLAAANEASHLVRTFATTTAGLIELSEWLEESGCTHVAMEATGVYWKPVWQVLADSSFELILANAAQVKNVPSRKTDVNDATWLSELLAHGLVRASFVPEPAVQELRGLLRTRKQLVREKASHVQRVQKTLEEANIKIESVLSDVMGHSGRAIIQALIDGETDPAKLAALAHWKVRASAETLREALVDGSNATIVSCFVCICNRSTRLILASQKLIRRSMSGSPAFVTPSSA